MVHIPVLKIDVPDPDISALVPAAVSLGINALTAVHDAVHGFLHPMSPEAQAAYEAGAVAAMPLEIRQARKRIAERRITDADKQSSELEEAAFSYYRRMIRTNWVGFSDEGPEDTAFRRLTLPGQTVGEGQPPAGSTSAPQLQAGEALADGEHADSTAAAAAAAAAAALAGQECATLPSAQPPSSRARHIPQGLGTDPNLPGVVQRAAVTTAAGGAGLAVGLGLVRLAAVLLRLRNSGGKRRGKRAGTLKGAPARQTAAAAAGGASRARRSGSNAPR